MNGRAIRTEDLAERKKHTAPHAGTAVEDDRAILDGLIRQELMAQAAERQGLDRDPEYRARVRQKEAELAELRREQLAALLERDWLKGKTQATEAEARAYFDANQDRIGTELHLHQILKRGSGALDPIKKALDGGASFDQVLAQEFGALPQGVGQPWDLGYLRWSQIPQEWRAIVAEMKPGDVSPIIPGPKDRSWIVRLVDRRTVAPSFEQEKATILEQLGAEKREAARRSADADLRRGASIVYLSP